jgi:hypothetical protein
VAAVFNTVFLHTGLPKTGSSYLQDSMHSLSQAGLLSRVAYPVATPDLGTGNGSVLAAELIFTNPKPTTTERLQALVEEIVQASGETAGNLLISSEDLCYADLEKFSRLTQVLLTHARSVKLLVCIRPLRDWSYSVYLQLVRAHALSADFDADWLRQHTDDFLFYFRNLDKFGVDTVCFRYQQSDLLPRFLGLLGEDPALASEVPETVVNRSLSVGELGVVRAINSAFGDEAVCRHVSDALIGQHPGACGARFPANRLADFEVFQAQFSQHLDHIPGPVMNSAKAILFEAAAQATAPTPPQGMAPEGTLATADIEAALRSLRGFFEARIDEGGLYRKLLGHASTLESSWTSFDPVHYLLMHPDVLRAGCDPLEHYNEHGRSEGRLSSFRQKRSG